MSNRTIQGELLPPRGPRERFDGDFARFGPEDLRRDAEHLRLLSIFYFILAGLQLFGVLFGLIYSVVGGVVLTVGAVASSQEGIAAVIFGAIFLVVGAFVLTVGYVIAAGGPIVVGQLRDVTGNFVVSSWLLAAVAAFMLSLTPFLKPRRRQADHAVLA